MAYEMVSPPDKSGGDVVYAPVWGAARAGIDGQRLAFTALGGFDSPSYGLTGSYVAERGEESWTTNSALLPLLPFPSIGAGVTPGLSPDASRVVTSSNLDPETGEPLPNGEPGSGDAFYLLEPATGEVDELVPPLDVNGDPYSPRGTDALGNADFSRVFYTEVAALTSDAVGLPTSEHKVYMWEEGELSLVSRTPDGSPSTGNLASPLSSDSQVPNVVSEDAQVLFFNPGVGSLQPLHRRDLSEPGSVIVNADENDGAEVTPEGATFVGASSDGSVAFFVSSQQLVDEDTDALADVYRYQHSQPAGSRLTLVSVDSEPGDTEAAVSQAHNVSGDGSTVVFASDSQLVADAPTDAGSKLYRWRDGQLSYIANLGAAIDSDFVHVSANGGLVAFLSNAAGITPDDNAGLQQVYVFDGAGIECISCVEGAVSTAAARYRFPDGLSIYANLDAQARNVVGPGRVVFQTAETLLPQDTNGVEDVYVWQAGELDLISTGRSGEGSFFLDATPDGQTLFFITREQLSGWDFDNNYDAYAARADGGLPEPPEPEVPCEGAECQGPPSLPPPFTDPATSDVAGSGNPEADGDCARVERRAERLSKKAKRLVRKAKNASGERRAELKAKAKKAKQKAKKAKQQANQCAAERAS